MAAAAGQQAACGVLWNGVQRAAGGQPCDGTSLLLVNVLALAAGWPSFAAKVLDKHARAVVCLYYCLHCCAYCLYCNSSIVH